MKDARGRVIRVGDQLLYGGVSRPHCINAAVVLSVRPKLMVRVLSTTEFGTTAGKEVQLGRWGAGFPLGNVMVVRSGGRAIDLQASAIRPFR